MRVDGASIATFHNREIVTTAKLCVQRLFVVLCHPQRILFYRTVLAHMQMASVWSEMDQLLAVHQFTAL